MVAIRSGESHHARSLLKNALHDVEPTGAQPDVGVNERDKIPGGFLKTTLPRIAYALARLRYSAHF